MKYFGYEISKKNTFRAYPCSQIVILICGNIPFKYLGYIQFGMILGNDCTGVNCQLSTASLHSRLPFLYQNICKYYLAMSYSHTEGEVDRQLCMTAREQVTKFH